MPPTIAALIKRGWSSDPRQRPTCAEIVDQLETDRAMIIAEFAETAAALKRGSKQSGTMAEEPANGAAPPPAPATAASEGEYILYGFEGDVKCHFCMHSLSLCKVKFRFHSLGLKVGFVIGMKRVTQDFSISRVT